MTSENKMNNTLTQWHYLHTVPVEPAGVAGWTFEDGVAEDGLNGVQTDGARLRQTEVWTHTQRLRGTVIRTVRPEHKELDNTGLASRMLTLNVLHFISSLIKQSCNKSSYVKVIMFTLCWNSFRDVLTLWSVWRLQFVLLGWSDNVKWQNVNEAFMSEISNYCSL